MAEAYTSYAFVSSIRAIRALIRASLVSIARRDQELRYRDDAVLGPREVRPRKFGKSFLHLRLTQNRRRVAALHDRRDSIPPSSPLGGIERNGDHPADMQA
jgi:hypothetical protein